MLEIISNRRVSARIVAPDGAPSPEPSPRGRLAVAVFRFNAAGMVYRLRFDPGTEIMFAALDITPVV